MHQITKKKATTSFKGKPRFHEKRGVEVNLFFIFMIATDT